MNFIINKNVLIFFILCASIIILSFTWDYIELPFKNITYTESHLINIKVNPNTDTLRYVIFVGTPLLLYIFLNFIFKRGKINFLINQSNKFRDAGFVNLNFLILFLLFFLFIILQYLSSPYNFQIVSPSLDALHDGDYLTPTFNYFSTKGLWSSSLSIHGGADFIYPILTWKLTGLKTIGAAKIYFPILIILLKIFCVMLAYQITRIASLDKNSELIFFTILSFFLISLSHYNAPINYSVISYRDIYIILFLVFFTEIFITNRNLTLLHTLIVFITFISLLFHFDTGAYLYAILFLYMFYLIIIKKYPQLIYILFLISLLWLIFFFTIGKNEFYSFFDNFLTIVRSVDLVHGYEYPTPFFSIGEDKDAARATRGLIFQIIAGILVIRAILFKNREYPQNYKIILLFFFVLSLIMYKNALGRSEAYHIRMSTDMQLIIISFFILKKLIKIFRKKIIHKKKYESFGRFVSLFFLITIIVKILVSSTEFEGNKKSNLQSILESKKNFVNYINASDEEFINYAFGNPKDIKKILIKFKEINKNEPCVQNFTGDLVLPYLLKKPTCTKYFASWLASEKENQIKYINQLKLEKPKYIIYKSPGFIVDKIPTYKRLKLVNSHIIKNYHVYENFNNYTILKINKKNES